MTTSSTTLTTTISGLTSGTQYTFTVAAQNLRGFSVESAPSSATTICACAATNGCCDGCFPLNVGGTCSDGKFCSVSDTCAANGTCQPGTPRDCTGLVTVNACQTPSCNTVSDSCVAQSRPDNTACNDANLCTTVDVCVAGACTGTMPVTCPETACRNVGTCVQATGVCTATNKADGLLCTPTAPNTEGQCTTGACQFSSCVAGYGDCSATAPGCESNLATDVNSCGTCGNACRTGTRFQHARTRCASSSCVFLGCDPGWQDTDNDCTTGAETCNTGCEACRALGDGSFDIPDDTVDNDCAGGDSTNTDTLGWYVDSSFTPAGTAACPGSVARGTRGCPFTSLYDVTFAASQQSWMPPAPARRYVYIAEGTYSDVGTVFETTLPLVYAGGYRRTMSGPWTRDGAASIVASTTAGAAVVAQRFAPSSGTWAVVDRLSMAQRIEVGGNFVLRAVTAPSSLILGVGTTASRGHVENTTVRGIDVTALAANPGLAQNWAVLASTIGSDGLIQFHNGWRVEGSTIVGNLIPRYDTSGVVIRDTTINGSIAEAIPVRMYGGLISDSSIGGHVRIGASYGRMTIRRTTLGTSNASGHQITNAAIEALSSTGLGLDLSQSAITASTISVNGTINLINTTASRCRLSATSETFIYQNSQLRESSVVSGVSVSNGGGQTQLIGNVIHGTPTPTTHIIRLNSTGDVITNNIIILGGAPLSAVAISEGGVSTDPGIVTNNAFIGFAASSIYLDEGTTPLADVGRLNTLSQLSACGRGGNLWFADNAAAGLLSSEPANPLFGRITAGPLIDAARPLPYTCNTSTIAASTTDITGSNARVCRTAQDIGAYEVCP